MRIFVKTLKGTHFELYVEPQDSVTNVKANIETVQGRDVYPAEQLMLIHQGKVLKDNTTLVENDVVEDSFIIVMVTKARPSSAPPTATQTPVIFQAPAPPPPPLAPVGTYTLTAPQLTPAVGLPVYSYADAYGQASSNLPGGSNLESMIQQILDMGGGSWDRDTVICALRAAFNNPERAVEYLYSFLALRAMVRANYPQILQPALLEEFGRQNPHLMPLIQENWTDFSRLIYEPVEGEGYILDQLASPMPWANPLDLFPQGFPNIVGPNASAGPLDFLRNSQQFQELRAMVQANPQILQPMLQELGWQNPHLMWLIQEHQADFFRLIYEPVQRQG